MNKSITLSEKDIARFLSKVDKERSEIFYNGTRCWKWNGGFFNDGYGTFCIGRKNLKAHRVSYKVAFGDFSSSLNVLHHCDNHSCVRPDHLFLGAAKDNMDDRDNKGRQARGEKHGMARLTQASVLEIRRLQSTVSQRRLAKMFNVGKTTIAHVEKETTWKDD